MCRLTWGRAQLGSTQATRIDCKGKVHLESFPEQPHWVQSKHWVLWAISYSTENGPIVLIGSWFRTQADCSFGHIGEQHRRGGMGKSVMRKLTGAITGPRRCASAHAVMTHPVVSSRMRIWQEGSPLRYAVGLVITDQCNLHHQMNLANGNCSSASECRWLLHCQWVRQRWVHKQCTAHACKGKVNSSYNYSSLKQWRQSVSGGTSRNRICSRARAPDWRHVGTKLCAPLDPLLALGSPVLAAIS